MKKKLTSRKFWMSVAGLVGGLGTAISGLESENEVIVVIGLICATASSAMYTLCESMVDIEAVPITDEEYDEYEEYEEETEE